MGAANSRGIAITALAAVSLAAITTLARLSYDAGSNPVTLVAFRALLGVFVLPGIILLRGHSLLVPSAARPAVLGCAAGLAIIGYGYMGSVAYIPIGLAALIMYSFPLLVLAAECVKAGRWPGPRRIAVFVTAFTGLGIALGPDLRTLDPIGIGLAFSASLGTVLFLFSGQRAAQHMDGMAVTALANFVLLPLAVGAVLATDGLQLPSGHLGWAALIGVGIAYLTGVTLQFMALRLVAPSLSALVLNVEPVLSIGIAWIVVGETMSALQLVGVGLAVSAISAGAWLSRTRGVMQES